MLPLLIILFIASYSLLTFLVFEQGRTIQAQRALLREMLKDSSQLADLKSRLAKAQAAEAVRNSPSAMAPQTKGKPKASVDPQVADPKTRSAEGKQAGKSARTSKHYPEKPAQDLQDVRRTQNIL